MNSGEVLIAVAPNGARRSKNDHSALPISPSELAECAVECYESGARMLHLHVRDNEGNHTISPHFYEPALKAISDAVGDKIIVQVTSESMQRYDRHQQMAAINSVGPECVSIAMRELIPSEQAWEDAGAFFRKLHSNGTMVQIILYSPNEVIEYNSLVDCGVIPASSSFLLFVVARWEMELTPEQQLTQFIRANVNQHQWMCCAFGVQESAVMEHVIRLGGHPRVGFENNICLPDGTLADSNSQLVAMTKAMVVEQNKRVAGAAAARQMFYKHS